MKKLTEIIGLIIIAILFISGQSAAAFESAGIAGRNGISRVVDPNNEQDPGIAKITRTFIVNSNDKVVLNNQYGALNVRTWDKNEVKLDVVVYGDPELDARQLLEMVSVNAVKKDGAVVLETRLIGSKRKNGKKIRVEFQVYMPEANNLELFHQYGNVNIGDFTGSIIARVQYGNFTAGNLKGSNNDLSIGYGSTIIKNISNAKISQEYGDGLTIGTVESLSLNAAYAAVKIGTITEKAIIKQQYGAGLVIGSVGQLNLAAAYANVQIGTIKASGKISNQYSNLNIGIANELNLTAQYSDVKIGRLNGETKMNIQYNNLNIEDVGPDCQSLTVECAYVKSAIKFNNSYNGNLDVSTSHSSFTYGSRISVRAEGDKQNKRYTGKIGIGGDSRVKLGSSYDSMTAN